MTSWTSPFQEWINKEMVGMVASKEIMLLLAKAFDGGKRYEREACAKVCDEIEQDRWNLYKGRPPYTGSEAGRADPHEQGVSMGAGECAAAIRARGEK